MLPVHHVLPYPITRHFQRYEYVVRRGWVTQKDVIDVGCGNTQGAFILAEYAKSVLGVDPILKEHIQGGKAFKMPLLIKEGIFKNNLRVSAESVFNINDKFNVAVCIEVFEHQMDVDGFLRKLAGLCEYLYITTPLAAVTGPTRNPDHVGEYSNEDFVAALEKHFVIQELLFQRCDMTICNYPVFDGDSFNEFHTVQMAWCKSKNL